MTGKKKSLVLELQEAASDTKVPISDLLRKALMVARKLRLTESVNWIQNELNGYRGKATEEAPQYRKIVGQLVARNPFHGWVPFILPNKEISEMLSTRYMAESVGEIEHLIEDAKRSNTGLEFIFSPDQQADLMETFRIDLPLTLKVPTSAVAGVLESVRNMILEWALKLEQEGILGEGLSFSSEELSRANNAQHTYIDIGTMVNSQIQQNSPNAIQSQQPAFNLEDVGKLMSNILKDLDKSGLSAVEVTNIRAEVETILAQSKVSPPKMDLILSCVLSVKNVLENAAGSYLAVQYLPALVELVKSAFR